MFKPSQKKHFILVLMSLWLVCTQTLALDLFPFNKNNPSRNLWELIREDFALTDLSGDPLVQEEISWFCQHRKIFYKMIQGAEPYIYYIHQEIRKRGLPGEVALIPMIESAYNPFRYSIVGAAGLWQIMPGTGSGLGLQIDWWYDGRRDITASTNAALDHFSHLNQYFDGDWLLSIAAYDSGEGTVQHAIEKNARDSKNVDFWSLPLPKETRRYIPRLLALAEIVRHPESYEFSLPYIPNKPYFSEVDVGRQIDLSAAADLAQVSLPELTQLNPGYNHSSTAPNGPFRLLLPIHCIDTFRQNLTKLSDHISRAWKTHLVKKGESLLKIAHHHNTSALLLKKINELPTNEITVGKILLIPTARKSTENSILPPEMERIGPYKVDHLVSAKDSLESLGTHYHVRPGAIQYWNRMGREEPLHEGSTVVIWTPLTPKQLTKTEIAHYHVRRGDNLSSIAHHLNIKVAQLKKWNPRVRKRSVRAGDNLIIRV